MASFETKEKADSITTYLTNAGESAVKIAHNLSSISVFRASEVRPSV